jgi:signal transduction histidine kinase
LDEAIPAYGLAVELRSVLEPERWAAAWVERVELLRERENRAGAEHEMLALARLLWGDEGRAMGALGDGARRRVEAWRGGLTDAGRGEFDALLARAAEETRRQAARAEAADAAAAHARTGATLAATETGLAAWKPVRNGGVAGVVLRPGSFPDADIAGPGWGAKRDGVTAPLPNAVGLSARTDRKHAAEAAIRRQRLLWGGGLAVLVTALGAGILFAFRAVRREGELARLKSDFVAQVSHELKTPLSLVRMYAETLAMGRMPEKRAEYLEVILRESERLTGMLEKILDFSRLENGERTFEPKAGDLAAAARVAAEDFERLGGPKVSVEAPAKVPATFDAVGVALALRNLLENAARYSEGSPDIRVVVESPGRIHVDDRGIGVAPADRERLFTRFFRSDDPRVRRVKGTGLGLALVAHVMAGHDGAATASPRPGGGTRFTLTFPRRTNGADYPRR